MEKVYELVIITTDGEKQKKEHSVLFSTKRKANAAKKKFYYENAKYMEDEIINLSFIVSRTLF